jgi:hypothetical protein
MSIENNENNLILSSFQYKNGEKIEINNINLPDSETPGYFLAQDANDIAKYINTIIQGISNSDSLHLSGLLLNEDPKLQVKIKNDSILIDSTGIYVNENNHRFLCSSLINNSSSLKFNWVDGHDHGTDNINNDALEVKIDNNTIITGIITDETGSSETGLKVRIDNETIITGASGLTVGFTNLVTGSFDPRWFRINPENTTSSGRLALNIGANNTIIYDEKISRVYC